MSSPLQETNRNRFDRIAAEWDDSPTRRNLAAGVATAITAAVPLSPKWQALEYGCGTGLVGAQLAPHLGHLLACDLSPGMLSVLADKAHASGLDNLETRQLDLTHEPPPAERYDLIFSSMTLHHIADVPALLKMFHGLLRDGGWLALADLDAEDGSFHSSEAEGVAHHGFERSKLSQWLETIGFREIQARTAHTIEKNAAEDSTRQYPVFLLTARR